VCIVQFYPIGWSTTGFCMGHRFRFKNHFHGTFLTNIALKIVQELIRAASTVFMMAFFTNLMADHQSTSSPCLWIFFSAINTVTVTSSLSKISSVKFCFRDRFHILTFDTFPGLFFGVGLRAPPLPQSALFSTCILYGKSVSILVWLRRLDVRGRMAYGIDSISSGDTSFPEQTTTRWKMWLLSCSQFSC
jgi:hypothetical protein